MNSLQDSLSENVTNNYFGFANLPNQAHRKYAKKGFQFTLMVVGEAGLGKSTLINSLFLTKLYKNRKENEIPSIDKLYKKIEIVEQNTEVEEKGVKLKLTIVDALNYGEAIDSKDSIDPIVKYIDDQFEKYLDYENGLNRRNTVDTRVHCCFYFISPIGYGLKPLDIEFLKQLSSKVNIIPIIAKADSLTKDEKEKLKKRILDELNHHQITIYTVPDCDSDEDPYFLRQMNEIKEAIPFAICSSVDKIEINGKMSLGRQYPYGTVDIMNSEHSDFLKLRSMLVSLMQDLREITIDLHYENFRTARLANGHNGNDTQSISNSFYEDEKDKMLREKENQLKKMQEMLEKMQMEMKLKNESQMAN